MTTRKSRRYLDNPHCQVFDKTIENLEEQWRDREDKTVQGEETFRALLDQLTVGATRGRDALLAEDGYRVAEGFEQGTAHTVWAVDVVPLRVAEVVAGALFDFVGYITTLDTPIEVGAGQEVYAIQRALEDWAARRDLALDNPLVDYWHVHVDKVDRVRGA